MRKLTPPEANWKALPFLRFILPLMLGIFLANHLAMHHFLLNILLVISFLFLFYFSQAPQPYSKRWMAGVVINFFLFILGYQSMYYQNDLNSPRHFNQSIAKENLIIGIVKNAPYEKNNRIKIELSTQLIGETVQNLRPCEGKILAYIENNDTPILKYGDQVLIKSKIHSTQTVKNPNAFNYGEFLHFQNIHFQLFAGSNDWKVLAENQGNPFWASIFDIRNDYLAVLEKYIQSEEEIAVAAALILGYKEKLSKDLKAAYSESGAIHVLAVSGLHVGIISAFLLYLLQFLPYKNQVWTWVKLGLVLICIWLFAFLTGLSPSVQRAAIMFSVFNIGLTLQRDVNIYNTLSIAAFFILIANPYALFDVGFQFSFLALTGIVFFSPKLIAFWAPQNLLLYKCWLLTAVGISAQLTVFPLVLYYFHQIPTYFWLSGLIVIPAVGVLLKLGILLLLTNGLSEVLSSALGLILTKTIALQNYLIHFIQEMPISVFSGFWISQVEVILFYGVVLGVALVIVTYNARWILGATLCLLLISCVQVNNKYQQTLQQKIVIYSINKNSVIDFVGGQTAYTIGDDKLSEGQFTYNVQNNRWASGIKEVIPIKEDNFKSINLFKKGNLLQFNKKRMVFISEKLPPDLVYDSRLTCDYIILQNSPNITLNQLAKRYKFRKLIFDGSNNNWFIKKWKTTCKDLGIEYKDVKNDGAYVINALKESTSPYFKEEKLPLAAN